MHLQSYMYHHVLKWKLRNPWCSREHMACYPYPDSEVCETGEVLKQLPRMTRHHFLQRTREWNLFFTTYLERPLGRRIRSILPCPNEVCFFVGSSETILKLPQLFAKMCDCDANICKDQQVSFACVCCWVISSLVVAEPH